MMSSNMKILKSVLVFTASITVSTILGTLGTLAFTLPVKAITISLSNGRVGNVDVATGQFTPFINSGAAFTDIAVNNSGQLFGTTFTNLYSINQSPGSSTFIGNEGISNVNGLGFDKNNVLYSTTISGDLYSINTSTGAASFVASIPGFSSAGDIVFNPATNQFLAASSTPLNSTLFSINPSNGQAVPIGSIGFSNVFGLGFDNGILYGYTSDGGQIIIDPTTGIGNFDRNVTNLSGGQIYGAASSISEAPPASVPESSSLIGLLVVGILGSSTLRKYPSKRKELKLDTSIS